MANYPAVGKTKYTTQTIQNFGFDEVYKIPRRLTYKFDPANAESYAEEVLENINLKIDEADSNTTYFGWAKIGTATSSALWRIRKMSKSGNVSTFQWCDGDRSFNNVWDNRAALSYS